MNTVSNSFTTFVAKIMAFFMMLAVTLFPNVPSNIAFRQSIDNDISKFAPKLVAAVENKDVAAMNDLMCANIKKNVTDLEHQIQEMYDVIDGEIQEVYYDEIYTVGHGRSFTQKEHDGKQIGQDQYFFRVKTSLQNYVINIVWETINTMKEDETQIRAIALAIDEEPYVYLKNIYATEGILKWHE